ncbi:hypothetical protein [Chrysiogenes arsenatis]|uniref:hypothetical protein n=1 Tax=Chrysiogenes arsenatis TaxID=309797 RepID=UPI00040CD1F1|nr:hypothetical protein [Chrysiogenes arsenatis]
MITHTAIEIVAKTDYRQKLLPLLDAQFPHAAHAHLVSQLTERIATTCKAIVLEHPYRDYDFSSVFSEFYAKKHRMPARDCMRLHLFADTNFNEYIGFCVVRDSSVDSCGRAIIDPAALMTVDNAHIITSCYKSHLLGNVFECNSIPWMAQDTDIAVCAHVAAWSIINYYASKYPHYQQRSIGEIAEQVIPYLGRKTPSEGLNLFQISELFSANRFYPLILKRQSPQDNDFLSAVFSYIESGIPMVAAMKKRTCRCYSRTW